MKFLLSFVLLGALGLVYGQLDRSIMPKPAPAPQIQIKPTETWTTANGITVILSENHKLPKVSFDLTLGSGATLEGEKAGLSELAGSLVMSGTSNRSKDQLDKEIDFLGASLSASASNVYLSVLTKHLDQGLSLMADVTKNASFPEDEFKRVSDQFRSGMVSLKSEAAGMAGNATVKVNFPQHPYGEVMTFTTLSAISLSDVKEFYRSHYTPQDAYLVIVGDINRVQAEKMINAYFGTWQGPKPVTAEYKDPVKSNGNQVYFVNKPGAVQSVIQVSFPIPMRMGNQDQLAMSVLNDVFGGSGFGTRLMQNLREDKAFTYGCYSGLNNQDLGGWISISGNFRNAVTDSAIQEILNELNRLLSETITTPELELTKAVKNGSFARSLERPQTIARFAYNISKYKFPEDYYRNYLQRLESIDAMELSRMAKTYIKSNNYNIVVVGNESVLDKIKAFDSDGKVTTLDEFGNIKLERTPSNFSTNEILENYLLAVTQSTSLANAQKKIKKVKNVLQRSELRSDKIPFPLQSYSLYTNKGVRADRIEFNGNVAQSKYYDGVSGYEKNMQTGKTVYDELKMKAEMLENALFPELLWLRPENARYLTLIGVEKENNKEYYVLQFSTGPQNESLHYYEKETFLKGKMVKTVLKMEESFSATTEYSDYRSVKGFMFPYQSLLNAGSMTFTQKIDEILVNGKVKVAEFQ
ncbi:MAG: insulinase family protein [Bacteroidetes bacterium]|nr:insulinase family protein [Bacteroidota bacterium]MBM3424361.1 insulinase family protein [Bacteroidota bacterium]